MVKRTRSILDAQNESVKRPRYATGNETLSADGIISMLRTQDVGSLRQGLIKLRSNFAFDAGGPIPDPQDERLVLAKSWLERSPGAEGMFYILKTSQRNPALVHLCFDILASVLDLLSTHFIYHPYGVTLLKALLLQSNLDILNSSITDGSQDVILSGLKLFHAMSTFAGGAEKRAVMDGFTWGQKSRQKLFFLRRKTKGSTFKRPVDNPDIRTLYIDFILSFLTKSTPTTIKVAFLEQYKETFLSIFKGIDQDPYHVIRRLLETSWEGIWNDNKLKRTMKITLFQERTLTHLLKLYDREEPEGDHDECIPANLVHHFLLAITTHPGTGICFHDRGWYPREENEDTVYTKAHEEEDTIERSSGKIYNKILSNILKLLKVNENPRQQELTFKILQACPELVNGYWTNIKLTLEPRLSSRWITNISILGSVISFPIPVESFNLPNSVHIHPVPPPLRTCMSNILPTVLNRTFLTKGLQSTSALVKHCTAMVLIKCLMKLSRVMSVFKKNSLALEENHTSGQWIQRVQDLQREAERRVPDVMVIIGMAQHNHISRNANSILLGECALRLLWLYQKLFPRLFSEVKFDTGKLLENALEPIQNTTLGHHSSLYQLHILRFLLDDDQFSGTTKMGSLHSQLYGILLLHARSESLVIRDIAATLSNKVLSSSVLFMHDTMELDLWLQAIPRTKRGDNAMTQDGVPLSDEVTAVLGFLDDCIQRCSKTPYKYLEDLRVLFRKTEGNDVDFAVLPSPLLVTVLEQLEAKIRAKLLTPSDTLALITFTRKLAIGLSTKLSNLNDTRIIQQKFEDLISKSTVISDSTIIQAGLQRECTLLSDIISFIENPISQPVHGESTIKSLHLLDSDSSSHKAYEIIDWLRFNISTLPNEDVKQLFDMTFKLHPAACIEFCYYLNPTSGVFKECVKSLRSVLDILPFELCDMYLKVENMDSEEAVRLPFCFHSGRSWNKSFTRRLATTLHRLKFYVDNRFSSNTLLNFIKQIISYGIEQHTEDVKVVAEALFVKSDVIRDICNSTTLNQTETQALSALVLALINPLDEASRESITSFCIFWTNIIKNTDDIAIMFKALPWIPYIDSQTVLHVLDAILRPVGNAACDVRINIIESVLSSMTYRLDDCYMVEQLQPRIAGLLSLRSSFEDIDKLILAVFEATLPIGYNGPRRPLDSSSSHAMTIATIAEQSRKKWSRKRAANNFENLHVTFSKLLKDVDRNGNALSVCFYKYMASRGLFKEWLHHNSPPPLLSPGYVFCLYSFLDSSSVLQESLSSSLPPSWSNALIAHIFHGSSSQCLRSLCVDSVKILLQSSEHRTFYATWLAENTQFIERDINPEIIHLIASFKGFETPEIAKSLDMILASILDWVANQFSNEEITITTRTDISLLVPVLRGHKFKPSIVEQCVKSAIRNHLDVSSVLDLCIALTQSVVIKPMIINQLLQSIVQHSRLYLISNNDVLIHLLYTLFHTHPVNTCQPSHVIPLLRLYRGTMALSDRRLLSIFQLYEKQTRRSIASLFSCWSPNQISTPSQNILKAVLALDPTRAFRTCLTYPRNRRLNGQLPEDLTDDQEPYDPLFLIPMAGQVVSMQADVSVPEWIQVFRTNVFSVVIGALSSKDDDMRRICVAILRCLHNRLQEVDMIEKNQVLYVLGILKNTLPQEDNVPKLPNFVVIFLAHALRCIFYPSSFLYPIISRFLLQRPEFDLTDVPLLYSLLFSIEDTEWVKERTWMIRYLAQVMDGGDFADWKILRRRHTWDLIASMWQASKPEEKSLRKGILELIANMTANQYAISSLVLRSQIICWTEMQLTSGASTFNELLAWLKIIENIVVIMDFEKAERSFRGTYSDSLIRCLKYALDQSEATGSCNTSQRLDLIYLTSRILLRISEKQSTHSGREILMKVTESVSKQLFSLEPLLEWSRNDSPNPAQEFPLALPPHKASGLYVSEKFNESGFLQSTHNCNSWALSVIFLWRVTMANTILQSSLWDDLTYRCLMLHSLGIISQDSTESSVIDWIRKRALECICADT